MARGDCGGGRAEGAAARIALRGSRGKGDGTIRWAVAGGDPGRAQELALALGTALGTVRAWVDGAAEAVPVARARRLAAAGRCVHLKLEVTGRREVLYLSAGPPPRDRPSPSERTRALEAQTLRDMGAASVRLWLVGPSLHPPVDLDPVDAALRRWALAGRVGVAVVLLAPSAGRREWLTWLGTAGRELAVRTVLAEGREEEVGRLARQLWAVGRRGAAPGPPSQGGSRPEVLRAGLRP